MSLLPSLFLNGRAALCAVLLATGALASPSKRSLTTVDFLEVLHPSHLRDAEWPDHLTFEVDAGATLPDFLRLLKANTWRTVYDCGGRPVSSHAFLFDGISRGYQETIFDDESATSYVSPLSKEPAPSVTTRYRVEALGPGRFLISFLDGHFDALRADVAIVKETGERVLLHADTGPNVCPDRRQVRSLRVPAGVPAF